MSAPEVPAGTPNEAEPEVSAGPLAWKLDGEVRDLAGLEDGSVKHLITFEDPEGKEVYRHSTAPHHG